MWAGFFGKVVPARCLFYFSALALERPFKPVPMQWPIGRAMVKETKFFRKQAAKAERMARSASDAEVSRSFMNMALAYRRQADVLKAKKKSTRKRP